MDLTREQIKEYILEIINYSDGLKNVDLALKVLERTMPNFFESHLYQESLDELVIEGKITEVVYVLPNMAWKGTKAIYFPKGTRVKAA